MNRTNEERKNSKQENIHFCFLKRRYDYASDNNKKKKMERENKKCGV